MGAEALTTFKQLAMLPAPIVIFKFDNLTLILEALLVLKQGSVRQKKQ
jgi:hypothetical protein